MEQSYLSYLLSGALLGLSAGITPGPILVLVITETLAGSVWNGVKVALAPLLTDAPIILVSVLILSQLSHFETVPGVVALVGGLFLLYLGYESITAKAPDTENTGPRRGSLKKGVLTNYLNPNPYLFWVTVGTPLVLKGSETSYLNPTLFIVGFFFCIIGSKIGVAILTSRFKGFLRSRAYEIAMKLLGGALVLFALLFLREGLRLLGIL
jgi:threonine/homoserine/homoserine lactone efflux protein